MTIQFGASCCRFGSASAPQFKAMPPSGQPAPAQLPVPPALMGGINPLMGASPLRSGQFLTFSSKSASSLNLLA